MLQKNNEQCIILLLVYILLYANLDLIIRKYTNV